MCDESFCRVIYLSRAVRPLSAPALDVLLAGARTRNAALGLTGFLALHEGRFFQVLEGPCPAVRSVLDDIRHDPRHRDLTVLRLDHSATRSFTDWPMGFADPEQLGRENMTAISELRILLEEGGVDWNTDPRIKALLDAFQASFRSLAKPLYAA